MQHTALIHHTHASSLPPFLPPSLPPSLPQLQAVKDKLKAMAAKEKATFGG